MWYDEELPHEAVLAESGLSDLKSLFELRYMREWDKCRRVCANNPRHEWVFKVV